MSSIIVVGMIVIASVGLGGCAALGLSTAALGAGAFSAGAGAAVDAGREYARGGVVYRTFSLPLHELGRALGEALERMELAVVREENDGPDRRIVAHARDCEIDIRLQPVTRTVTRMRLLVTEGRFRTDRATATEIITQTEHRVDERVAASVGPAKRDVHGTGASFPARGGRP